MRILITFIIVFTLASCSSNDDGCNCNGAIYKHAWTYELKTYHNEPMNCDTGTPKEPVKDEVWYFIECKDKPSY